MADIPRQRAANTGLSLPMVQGVEDPVQRILRDVQTFVNALDGRVNALENAETETPEIPEAYDDTELERKVRDLEAQVLRLKQTTVHLANMHPAHRLAKVVSRGEEYMICNWWDPVNATTSEAEVDVCYAPGADEGSYADDQIITVIHLRSAVVGSAGNYITWCDNSGGGDCIWEDYEGE